MQLSAAKDDLERPAANEPLDNPCEGRGAIYGRACPSRKMVKRKERKMAEQYVEQLAAARERIVADRRELADELAKPYERGRYELL